MDWVERAKLASVQRALENITSDMTLALGSGSTVELAIPLIGRLFHERNLTIKCVPSSARIESLAKTNGLTVTPTNEALSIQLAVDGADQLERSTLNMIKGRGGALLREKVLDALAEKVLIVVDERKLTSKLGLGVPVPVEVLPFAHRLLSSSISDLGGKPKLRMRIGSNEPATTDNGNYILDVEFGEISDAQALEKELHAVPGVIETGLFLGICDIAYVGTREGSVDVFRSDKA